MPSPTRKKNREIPDPIFRLLQTSRRVPPPAYVRPRSRSSVLSVALFWDKVWNVYLSRRRKKRDVYEELANTIDKLEEGTRLTDEEFSSLKDRIERQAESTKNREGE